MDMSQMKMGTPWLDSPVMLHSSRMYKCSLKGTGQCAYQQGYWRFWYEADHRYALPTIALFCATIGLFTLFAFFSNFAPRSLTASRPARKLVALNRYLSYKIFRIPGLNWNSAPLGVLLLGGIGAIFFFAMSLGPQPYYWPNTKSLSYGNSPPIATRTGWMALACLPFIIATSSKSNLITAFTGVSHEKLQIFHRWISYAMFILGLIHTFPFVVFHVWKGDMVSVWNTSVVYWTGVVVLLAQAWLTFASFSPLRNWSYEFFKFSHFLAALVFVIFFFFHCDFRLSSWDYFIATAVIFTLTWLHSQLRVVFEHGVKKATVQLESNGFVKVVVPTTSTWKAGQHYFIRFLGFGVHGMGSHPFTVCSLPEISKVFEDKDSELVFYIRPQKGFTVRLARYAEAHPGGSIRVMLDGPYGGCDMQKIQQSDRTLAIAGGSGAGFLLPLVEAFLRRRKLEAIRSEQGQNTKMPSLRVVLATRDIATRSWFEQAVSDLVNSASFPDAARGMTYDLNYTGSSAGPSWRSSSSLEDPEKAQEANVTVTSSLSATSTNTDHSFNEDQQSDSASQLSSANIVDKIHEKLHRPDLPQIVADEAMKSKGNMLGIFLCGPLSMQKDVTDATAKENLALMKSGKGEVYLHMEHFSWA